MRARLFLVVGAASALLSITAGLPAAAAVTPGRSATAPVAGTRTMGTPAASAAPADAAPMATFFTAAGGATGVTCTQSNLTLVAGAAGNFSVTVWTFAMCASNIMGVTGVKSVSVLNLPYNAVVNFAVAPPTFTVNAGAAGPIQFNIALNTVLGLVTCAYRPAGGAMAGTTNAAVTAVTFTNVAFNLNAGPAVCPKNMFFSAAYA